MTGSFNERLIAYLALLSGLSISAVAVYYSVVGLTAIFSTAVIPIIIMGVTLEIGKLIATLWLKQNWNLAPVPIKAYLLAAIFLLMFITSMGIFGYLSKAHSDQSLVSSDVLSKLAIYEEKIKTAKENIQEKRKELKQMDEAVDQVMVRSKDEKGADKSIALRKSQQRDRVRISKEIEAEQARLSELSDQALPLRAKVKEVEAEVGPLKYIAALIYGENTDTNTLEAAVRWVIILIVIVFDPLALILLLASQISFQRFRELPLAETPVEIIKPAISEINSASNFVSETKTPVITTFDSEPIKEQLPKKKRESKTDLKRTKLNIKEHRGGSIIVEYYVNLIRSKQLKLSQVPDQIVREVKQKLNEK